MITLGDALLQMAGAMTPPRVKAYERRSKAKPKYKPSPGFAESAGINPNMLYDHSTARR